MDEKIEIRRAVDTGKTIEGTKEAEKTLLKKEAQLIVMTKSLGKELKERITHYCKLSKTPILEFSGTSQELGAVCGKPYPISALTITDKGKSSILETTKQETKEKETKAKKTKTTKKAKTRNKKVGVDE